MGINEFRERRAARADYRSQLESEFETSGHPKAEKLFDLAWDYGHSSGLHEVKMYYEELKELLG